MFCPMACVCQGWPFPPVVRVEIKIGANEQHNMQGDP